MRGASSGQEHTYGSRSGEDVHECRKWLLNRALFSNLTRWTRSSVQAMICIRTAPSPVDNTLLRQVVNALDSFCANPWALRRRYSRSVRETVQLGTITLGGKTSHAWLSGSTRIHAAGHFRRGNYILVSIQGLPQTRVNLSHSITRDRASLCQPTIRSTIRKSIPDYDSAG